MIVGLAIVLLGAEAHSQVVFTRVFTPRIGLAGHDLNGVSLNGDILDGSRITSVSAVDAELDGDLLELVWLRDSRIIGYNGWGRYVPHNRMVGASFHADLDNGGSVRLRIDDLQRNRDRANRDTYLYEVSYETDDGWVPLCGVDEVGDPIAAIALEGRWDYSEGTETGGAHVDDEFAFTFACRGYVIAKCVEAGYKPWRQAMVCAPWKGCKWTSLAAHHQACTRMLRADYCGDGTSHTVDNVPVNFYDALGVRYDSQRWLFEAEWDEAGAICAVTERIPGNELRCGEEWLIDEECGDPSHFADGVLLFSEVTPSSE
jgi:hypothetical protein